MAYRCATSEAVAGAPVPHEERDSACSHQLVSMCAVKGVKACDAESKLMVVVRYASEHGRLPHLCAYRYDIIRNFEAVLERNARYIQ